MKKYKFSSFEEILVNVSIERDFDTWETQNVKENDINSIYEVDFMNENEEVIFTLKIIEDNNDHSCDYYKG